MKRVKELENALRQLQSQLIDNGFAKDSMVILGIDAVLENENHNKVVTPKRLKEKGFVFYEELNSYDKDGVSFYPGRDGVFETTFGKKVYTMQQACAIYEALTLKTI